MVIAAHSISDIDKVKAGVNEKFEAHDFGKARFFLGMAVDQNRSRWQIRLGQKRLTAHCRQLLDTYIMADCKGRSLPLSVATQLTKAEREPLGHSWQATYNYTYLAGSLLYLSVCTRPVIAQDVGALYKYMTAPTTVHWQAAKGVLRYVASTKDQGIESGSSPGSIIGYCVAEYAGDLDARRSTTAYVFILHEGAITWLSKRQSTVAASTTKQEHIATAETTKEALWLRVLLRDLGVSISTIQIYADNQSVIATQLLTASSPKLLKNPDPLGNPSTYHFARERAAREEIEFQYIKTDEMLADMLTKSSKWQAEDVMWRHWLTMTDLTSLHGSVEMYEQSCQVCTFRPQKHALAQIRPLCTLDPTSCIALLQPLSCFQTIECRLYRLQTHTDRTQFALAGQIPPCQIPLLAQPSHLP